MWMESCDLKIYIVVTAYCIIFGCVCDMSHNVTYVTTLKLEKKKVGAGLCQMMLYIPKKEISGKASIFEV